MLKLAIAAADANNSPVILVCSIEKGIELSKVLQKKKKELWGWRLCYPIVYGA